MCCLFGMVNYSGKKYTFADSLVNNLAQEATIRGTDSTGIAYNKDNRLIIYKKPLSAYRMNFKGLDNCICVTGHTRHATQGTHKKNYNNHPFMGNCNGVKFALAHNGVLWNDSALKRQYSLPHDRIETDSFVAVQLLEHFKKLNFDNVANMAQLISGSFAFTMVDSNDSLWIVKGDSPLTIIHFPERKMYVYASTEEILFSAMSHTDLVNDIMNSNFELVEVNDGDIIRINKHGKIEKAHFVMNDYNRTLYNWETWSNFDDDDDDGIDNFYRQWLDDIKSVARSVGLTDDDIDKWLDDGYTLDEIEDFIYYA